MIRRAPSPPRAGHAKRLILRAVIALTEDKDVLIVARTAWFAQRLAAQVQELAIFMKVPGFRNRLPSPRIRFSGLEDAKGVKFSGVTLMDHTASEETT